MIDWLNSPSEKLPHGDDFRVGPKSDGAPRDNTVPFSQRKRSFHCGSCHKLIHQQIFAQLIGKCWWSWLVYWSWFSIGSKGLGPALGGGGTGLLRAMQEAIQLSENLVGNVDPALKDSEDYVDMGEAILNFYSVLVDLLGRCSPDAQQLVHARSDFRASCEPFCRVWCRWRTWREFCRWNFSSQIFPYWKVRNTIHFTYLNKLNHSIDWCISLHFDFSVRLIDRSIDWLIDCGIDWSIDWSIDRRFDWLIDCGIDWSIDWWIDCGMDGLIDWLTLLFVQSFQLVMFRMPRRRFFPIISKQSSSSLRESMACKIRISFSGCWRGHFWPTSGPRPWWMG